MEEIKNMTAFKRYTLKKSSDMFKPDEKYIYLPYEVSKGIFLETTIFNTPTATIHVYYNVISLHYQILRNGKIIDLDLDENPHF